MIRMKMNLAVLVVLALLSACAPMQEAEHSPTLAVEAADVVVEVRNHNWQKVAVYALVGQESRKLGDVNTSHTGTFRIRNVGMQSVRLQARPLGTQRGVRPFETEPIQVGANRRIVFNVENAIQVSSWQTHRP